MAERRMFAKTIVLSDAFLDMPMSARCLYFTLGMFADDDGFVNAPKAIMRQCGASEDDMRVLVAKKFVILFESGVIVIKHWRINNYLRSDRYTETKHIDEKNSIVIESNGAYHLRDEENNSGIPPGIPNSGIPSIGKYSIGKDSIDKNNNTSTESDKQTTVLLSGIKLPLVDKTVYDVPIPNIEMWKEAFPAVDVEGELFRMNAWLNSNPTKRKTRRGINRFINTWLSKVQDKGGSKYIPKPTIKKQVEEEQALDLWGDD